MSLATEVGGHIIPLTEAPSSRQRRPRCASSSDSFRAMVGHCVTARKHGTQTCQHGNQIPRAVPYHEEWNGCLYRVWAACEEDERKEWREGYEGEVAVCLCVWFCGGVYVHGLAPQALSGSSSQSDSKESHFIVTGTSNIGHDCFERAPYSCVQRSWKTHYHSTSNR